MKATDKNKIDEKLISQSRTNFINFSRGSKLNQNQQFVVPWQMEKSEESKKWVKQF
jgi:hypothetical protein